MQISISRMHLKMQQISLARPILIIRMVICVIRVIRNFKRMGKLSQLIYSQPLFFVIKSSTIHPQKLGSELSCH
jgi:hypothetical protein